MRNVKKYLKMSKKKFEFKVFNYRSHPTNYDKSKCIKCANTYSMVYSIFCILPCLKN